MSCDEIQTTVLFTCSAETLCQMNFTATIQKCPT